jgi:hypothetical protein
MEGDAGTGLSPTVSQVFEQFISRIRADDRIGSGVADRLETLLSTGETPKPDELLEAFADRSPGDEP